MLHPFSEDSKNLTVPQMHEKIQDLTKKYFQTNNPQVKQQIQTFIDYYRTEVAVKEAQEVQSSPQKGTPKTNALPHANC